MERKIRVLVGKPGLDGHDRGAKVVAAALRDAGMEVIYTGLHQTPEQIVEAAIQEDVDVVALSVLSGAHMTLFPEVRRGMVERGVGDKLLTGGGIIPVEDMEALAKQGVGRLFGPGSSTQEIAAYIRSWCEESRPVPAPEAKARATKPRTQRTRARAPRPARAKSAVTSRKRAKPPARPARKRPLGKAVRRVTAPRPARSRARKRR
jgi:methylmalonyl-CoA mutase C-terminal domain/subunit